MNPPRLYLVVGPNGAGKSTFVRLILAPALPPGIPFVNADDIARLYWPGVEEEHAYDASDMARLTRDALIDGRRSFIAETVASHPSKLDLVHQAQEAGYAVQLSILMVTEDQAVARVQRRVAGGGHSVPEPKVRARYRRLWANVAGMAGAADVTFVYDNSGDRGPRLIARVSDGYALMHSPWPTWTPAELRAT